MFSDASLVGPKQASLPGDNPIAGQKAPAVRPDPGFCASTAVYKLAPTPYVPLNIPAFSGCATRPAAAPTLSASATASAQAQAPSRRPSQAPVPAGTRPPQQQQGSYSHLHNSGAWQVATETVTRRQVSADDSVGSSGLSSASSPTPLSNSASRCSSGSLNFAGTLAGLYLSNLVLR